MAAATVAALLGVMLAAHGASAARPSAAGGDAPGLTEAQRALAEAKESGRQVEVVGERSERSTVYANPDGFTFTLEESAVPVRVPDSEGGWQAPDSTLEKRSDGSIGPKGAAADISFSPGGSKAPLARIADQGRSLAFDWPGELPPPRLDGPSALYAEVLPGVDLKVTATAESFQQVFVVKTREAAKSDELKKLTFGLSAQHLDVHEGAAGNLSAVDGSGRTVFRAPPARMWDSAGGGLSAEPQLLTADTPGSPEVEPSDRFEQASSGSGLEPGQGDKVARMDIAVTENSLSVVPDAKMLSTTDDAAFPLFIDPTVSWGESERTLLRSDGYESYGWSNGDDDQGKGAGKCGTWNGYYCGPGYVSGSTSNSRRPVSRARTFSMPPSGSRNPGPSNVTPVRSIWFVPTTSPLPPRGRPDRRNWIRWSTPMCRPDVDHSAIRILRTHRSSSTTALRRRTRT